MGSQPQAQPQPELLSRASAELLAELLKALGDAHLLLEAGLRLAIQVLNAKRGLAFDTAGEIASAGMTPEAAETIRQERLGPLLEEAGMRYYSRAGFDAPTEGTRPVVGVVGMAGTISTKTGSTKTGSTKTGSIPAGSFVLAVERGHKPFDPADQQVMAELLQLLTRPFVQAAATRLRLNGEPEGRKLSPAELPLNRLEPFPLLQEMERLLIREALNRCSNNRTRAAAALGLAREGLRKKLNRYRTGS